MGACPLPPGISAISFCRMADGAQMKDAQPPCRAASSTTDAFRCTVSVHVPAIRCAAFAGRGDGGPRLRQGAAHGPVPAHADERIGRAPYLSIGVERRHPDEIMLLPIVDDCEGIAIALADDLERDRGIELSEQGGCLSGAFR